mgnify:CR=1 FL=1
MGNQNASLVDEWLNSPMKLELLKCWARDFPLVDVAKKMGVTIQTLRKWKKEYPAIKEAIEESKEILDYRVENALIRRALGFMTTETKTILYPPDKNGNRRTRIEKLEKEIPPDTTAIMAFLNNRKPDQWKRNRDNVLQTNDSDNKITVNIIKHSDKDKDEEWDVTAEAEKSPKVSTKKVEAVEPKDLDYWPEDWEDEDEN